MKEAIATLAVRIIAATLTMGGIFVLARVANSNGADDVKWVPGANR